MALLPPPKPMQKNLTSDDISAAHFRIKNHIKNTPVISSKKLNEELGAEVFFKMDNQQEAGSFKARGAFNAILTYKEKHGKFPEKIVVQSSGNHATAIAFACKKFGIPALIYMIKNASPFKIAAVKNLGAEVVLLEKRSEVNRMAEEKQKEGYFFIHPSSGEDVICGQGTATFEALSEIGTKGIKVSAIFTPCGGGGLVVGSFLAAQKFSPAAKIFGCEPLSANDVAISLREGKIFHFEDTPNTIADGARTLAISERCFGYVKQLAGILEISEEEIFFWQKKLAEEFQQKIEPTSALAIAGVVQYLKKNSEKKNQKILVVISGGNVG
jgi:threonine dehydratase